MAAKVQIQDFSVTKHARKGVHYRFRSTPSCAATIDPLDSDELKKTRGDPSMTLTDEAALVASMPLQLREMKIVGGDRLRSRPGRLPTLFFGVVRLRARPQRQLLDSPEVNRVLNRFQNQVLTVAQLRNLVIAILQHLPEFDPGDHQSIEDEGALSFNLGAVSLATVTITITRRLAVHQRACSAAGQPKPFPNLFVEVHEGLKKKEIWGFYSMEFWLSKKKVWGFSRDFDFVLSRKKKNWEFLSNDRFNFVMEEVLCVVLVEKVKDLGVVLMEVCGEKEEDLCSVEGRRNEEEKLLELLSERREDFKGCTPNLITKRCRFSASRIGLVGSPNGRSGSKHDWTVGPHLQLMNQQLSWAAIAIVNFFNSVGPFGDQNNWSICGSATLLDRVRKGPIRQHCNDRILQILAIWAIIAN